MNLLKLATYFAPLFIAAGTNQTNNPITLKQNFYTFFRSAVLAVRIMNFEFEHLKPAELKLLAALKENRPCIINPSRPNGKEEITFEQHIVRSKFIQLIIDGNIDSFEMPPVGIIIIGAWISGDLELNRRTINHPIHFENCVITGRLNLNHTSVDEVVLKGSKVFKFCFNGMLCKGNVILSYDFHSNQTVEGRAAKIFGQLGCSGGIFANRKIAMCLESTIVTQGFFWRFIKHLNGRLDLTNAKVGVLIDDAKSWPPHGMLYLDGFTYSQLGSNSSPHYFDRIEWLKLQYPPHLSYDFRPQPFEQLKSVLEKSGRENEAKKVAVEKLNLQRRANFFRRNPKLVDLQHNLANAPHPFGQMLLKKALLAEKKQSLHPNISNLSACLNWTYQFLFGAICGYGYRPLRCVGTSVFMILCGSFVFSEAYSQVKIAPRHSVLLADEWSTAVRNNPTEPYQEFYTTVPSYPKFNSISYAVDTFIPLVDLNQDSSWTVSTISNEKSTTPWTVFLWLYIILGWVLTAILAASITGIIRR